MSKSEFLRRLCNGIYDHDQIPESKNSLWCSLARSKPYEYLSGSGLNAGRVNFHSVHGHRKDQIIVGLQKYALYLDHAVRDARHPGAV